jgi:hypothetical protein
MVVSRIPRTALIRKPLLILANSIKRNERCIAGRELIAANNQTVLASWIRPISNHDEGELTFLERVLAATWMEVGVGDVVEVSVDRPLLEPTQPENWLLSGNGGWTDVSAAYLRPSLDDLEESPASLWQDPGAGSDRVRAAYLYQHPPQQSLYVVRAERLVVRLQTDSQGRPSYRCRFDYLGQPYDLSLTDPSARSRLQSHLPRAGVAAVDVPIGTVRVCVSLAGAFQGYHYKVVATILEGL